MQLACHGCILVTSVPQEALDRWRLSKNSVRYSMFVEPVLWFCITFTCLSSPKITYFSSGLYWWLWSHRPRVFWSDGYFEQVFSEIKCFFYYKSLLFFFFLVITHSTNLGEKDNNSNLEVLYILTSGFPQAGNPFFSVCYWSTSKDISSASGFPPRHLPVLARQSESPWHSTLHRAIIMA